MGLDMYLSKAKYFAGLTIKDILNIDEFFKWKKENTQHTLEEWCGVKEEDLNFQYINLYRREFKERTYYWDSTHDFSYNSIITEVGYWRKANQIHNWFVDNVQYGNDDCGSYEVKETHLRDLLEICLTVREHSELIPGDVHNGDTFKNGRMVPLIENGLIIKDPVTAMELLPCQSGFFFGSTEYDEYYMRDINSTIEILEKVLESTDFEHEVIIYSSSW